jgi:hypothetical protein
MFPGIGAGGTAIPVRMEVNPMLSPINVPMGVLSADMPPIDQASRCSSRAGMITVIPRDRNSARTVIGVPIPGGRQCSGLRPVVPELRRTAAYPFAEFTLRLRSIRRLPTGVRASSLRHPVQGRRPTNLNQSGRER